MHSKPRFSWPNRVGSQLRKWSRTQKSPLSEGVFDFNIDVETPGSLRIALWNEWRSMLENLGAVGPVWRIVRNEHCVLAIHGTYPELAFSSDQLAANAHEEDSSLTCHFSKWRQAVAFDSGCCCGRVYGVEIENASGEVFQRICLAKEADLAPFVEWIQTHQATGLEIDEPVGDANQAHPLVTAPRPDALQVSPRVLRTILITAAQREIPLEVSVMTEGMSQTTRIDVLRASEAHGWLVLSGNRRSLYVATEPSGTLVMEPRSVEGEMVWTLSLLHPEGRRLMHLRSSIDGQSAWNRLVRELLLGSPGLGPIS